jgi:hypothetical protein
MRSALQFVLLALLAPLFTSCLGKGGNSVNLYGGRSELQSDDISSLDEQTVYGADLVWKIGLPFTALEGGVFRSEDESGGSELTSDDFFIGVRVTPWEFLISPYGAAGVSYLDSTLDGAGGSESDEVVAYYLRLGASFNLLMFRVGLDARALYSDEVDFGALETDLDRYQLTAFIGIGF